MTQIPPRILAIWENGVNIQKCAELMETLKLECSTCGQLFGTEFPFKCHISKCLKNRFKDRNYLVHMYSNRLVVLQNRYALYCGVTAETNFRQCVCEEEFDDYAGLRNHTKQCTEYNKEYFNFLKKTLHLFNNLIMAYNGLGRVFQKFKGDRNMIAFTVEQKMSPDHLKAFFDRKEERFIGSLINFTHEVFLRFLRKQSLNVEDEVDYLQKDPWIHIETGPHESGYDTETEDRVEDETEDMELGTSSVPQNVSRNDSTETSTEENGQEDDAEDMIIDVVGLDEDMLPVVVQEFDFQYENSEKEPNNRGMYYNEIRGNVANEKESADLEEDEEIDIMN